VGALAWLFARRANWRTALGAIVLAGLLARGAILVRDGRTSGGRLDDPDNYLPLARSLAEGKGFSLDGRPTAYRPPLYPLLLAPLTAMLGDRTALGVGALHLVLGAGATILTAVAARRFGLSPGRALLASAVVALDPVLIAQVRPVMTETLAAFLTAATLAALTVPGLRGATLAGVMFGLSALCRPSAWPAAWIMAAALAGLGPGPLRSRLNLALTLIAATVLTVAPWAFRNLNVFGEPIWTTTHGGYTLSLANNPVYYDEVVNGPPGAVWSGHNQWLWWDSVNRSARGLPEPDADRLMRRKALAVIASRPGDFLRATLARLERFWGLAPSGTVYAGTLRVATALWTAPLWAALVLGLARRSSWRWPMIAAPIVLLSLSAIHSVYWTDMRMRATAVPAIALIAASAQLVASRVWGNGVFTAVNGAKKNS
jgi:hypothetical protein